MNRYDKGCVFNDTWDILKFYTRHIEGPKGVLAEMIIRASFGSLNEFGKHFVSRSSFKRTCKRHKASQKESLKLLIENKIVSNSFTYGNYLECMKLDYLPLKEWNEKGFRVIKGEQSYVRREWDNTPLFNDFQVTPKP